MFGFNNHGKGSKGKKYHPPKICEDCRFFDGEDYCYKLNHYVKSDYKACRCAEWNDDDYEELFA